MGRGRAGPAPEPTPEPTSVPTLPVVVSNAVCERIDASGTIVVGTAGDYPPFEYYDDQFQLDGFDMALIRDIGEHYGWSVQLKDYAFDGLLSAVQLGEVDVAIAALTITEDRQTVVDFTDPYYAGQGAAVVQADSSVTTITSPADFAGQRLGTERGTVYQSWAEENLVKSGILSQQQLFLYEKATDAVGDLQQDRLDVVLLDDQVAKSEAISPDLRVAGEGGIVQLYAIAVPEGADCLRTKLNGVLALFARNAGIIDGYALKYFGVPPLPLPTATPTPSTPAPTATPVPAPVCIDSSEFVMDLTYDDQGGTAPPTVQPGELFTKGWRIRNSGTCRWGPDYRLSYAGGNNPAAQMDGESVYITAPVEAGQTYDFYVDLKAPSGVYGVMQGRWQMQDPGNSYFGQTVWVMVDVVAPTPGPTAIPPTASPTVAPTALPTGAPTVTPPQPTPTPLPDPLTGQTFEFYAIQGQATIPGVPLTVTFGNLGGTGGLSGSDGCNIFNGTYSVTPSGSSEGALTISLGVGTTLACDPQVMDQAQVFRAALAATTAYFYPPQGLLIELLDQTGAGTLSGQIQ